MERKRSWEFIAIPVVLVMFGILAIIMWAADGGMWPWITVGLVLLTALVVFTVAYMRRPHHPVRTLAPTPAPIGDGTHRVLVVADDDCPPADLGAVLAEGGDAARTAVFVVAPALGSRTARWTGDDHAYRHAQHHLDASLNALSSLGVDAKGHIGPHDPLQAADDGLREFPADEIVFAVHPSTDANWLEQGVVDDARARYAVPVRELVIGPNRA
jgi:GABA permease